MEMPKHIKDAQKYFDRIVKDVQKKYDIPETKARELVGRTTNYNINTEADVHYLVGKWLSRGRK